MKPFTAEHASYSLLTDSYQLTMAYGYWKAGMADHEAVFHLFFRHLPFQGGYAIAAGLAKAIACLDNWCLQASDLAYLATLKGDNGKPLFNRAFLAYLKNLRLKVDIEAIPEGTLVFPHQPLVRVQGPLLQCQLLETLLLNCINFSTLVATKASRVCYAAKGDPVLEFGLRRAQGGDGGLTASRAAYIGGCAGTSNLLAGKLYDIPVRGTHAHSWVMAFPTEMEAFNQFVDAMPNNAYLLVDTYHSLEGVKHAIAIGKRLKQQGRGLSGIRLDSGDLAQLSKQARKILDAAGLKKTAIMGSNDLDEYIIASLKQQHAKINVWGVGTKLSTCYDQPALDGVYKMSALRAPKGEWQYKLKLSESTLKISTPGLLRTRRYWHKGHPVADIIYDECLGVPSHPQMIDIADPAQRYKIPRQAESEELLRPIFRKGKLVYKIPPIQESRLYAQQQLAAFPQTIRRFLNPSIYPVGLEKQLFDLRMGLILRAREKIGLA